MTRVLICSLAGALLGTAAVAQTMPGSALNYIDSNADSNVTVEEFVAGIDRLFVPLDANGNGRIEWSEAEVTVTRDVFDAADTNANGSLSKGEFDAQLRKDFQTADRDGDGVLD